MSKIVLLLIWLLGVLVLQPFPGHVSASGAIDLNELDARIAEGVTIEDLIAYAIEMNPGIKGSIEAHRSAKQGETLASALPDPQFMISYFPEPIETRLGPQDWTANLTQMIPFPTKLSKAGKVAEANTRITSLNRDKAVRDVTAAIKESFYELYYIREARQIAGHNMELIDHLRKVAETSYAQYRTILMDVIKAQSQTAQIQYDILLLDELEQTELVRLNGLLNRAPDTPIGELKDVLFPPLLLTLDELYGLAESYQQEIQISNTQIQRADLKLDLAKANSMPNFRIGLFYSSIGEPDSSMTPDVDAGRDAIGIQAGISIPLWIGKNSSRKEGARADFNKQKSVRQARLNETRTNLSSLYFRLQNSRRLMTLYREELLPQAARSIELAETWFRQGEGSFSNFVEAQSVLYNFQLSVARASADYGKYLARLEKLTGCSLTGEQANLSVSEEDHEEAES